MVPPRNPGRATNPMATFYKFGKLWDIPPAAARLGKSLPANKQAFATFRTDLEPMLTAFICAHPRCPKAADLPAIRYAIKEFMEERSISNPAKERWAATYNPAKKVTYCSWFLTTVSYFLDKLDFTTLPPPPPPIFPVNPFPPPPLNVLGVPSSTAPAAKPARQSRLWHGGPTPQAFREERRNEERLAQLRHFQREASSAFPTLIGNADDVDQSD
jgi:hypothetical protein